MAKTHHINMFLRVLMRELNICLNIIVENGQTMSANTTNRKRVMIGQVLLKLY